MIKLFSNRQGYSEWGPVRLIVGAFASVLTPTKNPGGIEGIVAMIVIGIGAAAPVPVRAIDGSRNR